MQCILRQRAKRNYNVTNTKIKRAGRKLGVEFEDLYYYQEEALNTILPIGECFLNVKKNFMRKMTTANIATQVPFTNVDLKSESSLARYYGQNQLSNNIITLDRKRDLNTGSGVVLGSSGSGKSTTIKGWRSYSNFTEISRRPSYHRGSRR